MTRRRDEIPTGIACTACKREIGAPIEWRERDERQLSFAKTSGLAPYCRTCAKRIDERTKRR
jgi:hypothetical protein